jgi:hypothetical protein
VHVTNGTPQDKLNFHIRVNKTNPNGGFFSPDSSEHWYWPVNGKNQIWLRDLTQHLQVLL